MNCSFTKSGQYQLSHSASYPVSEDIRAALERYLNGIPTGGFLNAVLEGNLFEAFGRADTINTHNMRNIVGYIWNTLPTSSYGTPLKVRSWLNTRKEELMAMA